MVTKKICKRCGKEFESEGRFPLCDSCKVAKCAICGKEFEVKLYAPKALCCSSRCRGEYAKRTGLGKMRAAAASATLKSRYGKTNASQVAVTGVKVCAYCGKEFQPKTNRQIYCEGPHYASCAVCGKQFEYDPLCPSSTCSTACRVKLSEQTNLERYGNATSVNSDYARSKAKATMLDKYGVDHYSKTDEYKLRMKEVMGERHGGTGTASPEIRAKIVETNNNRLGVDFPMQSEDVRSKGQNSTSERYGGVGLSSPVISDKIKSTMVNRYGADNPAHVAEIRQRIASTCYERYGRSNWKGSEEGIKHFMTDPSKYDKYEEFCQDCKEYIHVHYSSKPSIWELSKDLGVSPSTVGLRIQEQFCQNEVRHSKSTMEEEISSYIMGLLPGVKLARNDHTQIRPMELDIWLPDYNIAIECNPTYTHNSSFGTMWASRPIPASYHAEKSRLCRDKGISLVHIFGYEWSNHKEVVLSRICNMLHRNKYRYYARNLVVRDVPNEQAKKFLDDNHIQGYAVSKVRIGLYQGDELISIMTFSQPRAGLGYSKSYSGGTWELTRFCTKLYSSCVGGASKLFRYFVGRCIPEMVVSFSNMSNTDGGVYGILGFHEDGKTSPGYVWVNMKDDTYFSRVQCQKRNIPKLFNEPEIDICNKTESQLMEEHGYGRVFNSGLIKWVWKKDVS